MKILSFKEYCKEYCEQSDFYQELIWVYCFFCKNRYLKRLYERRYLRYGFKNIRFQCCCGHSGTDTFERPQEIIVLCS